MNNNILIVLATSNKNKVREINEMLEDSEIKISSPEDAGIDMDGIDIEENGDSFEENALIKARAIAGLADDAIVIADDSGLVIDALSGEPGIHSSRFMGEETPYEEKCRAILDKMKDIPNDKRSARFVCSMAVIYPDGREKVFTGFFEGFIAHEAKGGNGFGYDPIFFVPEYGMTSAEISAEEKNSISHRGKALAMVMEDIKNNL